MGKQTVATKSESKPKEEPKTAPYEDNLKILLGMIKEAKEVKQLTEIFNLNKDYQSDSVVLSALTKRKEELKQSQNAA